MDEWLTGTLSFPSYIIQGNKNFLAIGSTILREMHAILFRKRIMHWLGLCESYKKMHCNTWKVIESYSLWIRKAAASLFIFFKFAQLLWELFLNVFTYDVKENEWLWVASEAAAETGKEMRLLSWFKERCFVHVPIYCKACSKDFPSSNR